VESGEERKSHQGEDGCAATGVRAAAAVGQDYGFLSGMAVGCN
jgi:hypothetical protein